MAAPMTLVLLNIITLSLAGTFAEAALIAQHDTVVVMNRQTLVYKPHGTRKKKLPGVFVLHGSFAVSSDMFFTGFDAHADALGFLVVYPEMATPGGADWNYHNEIPFFQALAWRLQESDYGLDAAETFICGHSAGGSLTLFLQNQVDIFKAAAAVEAATPWKPEYVKLWNMSKPGHPTMVVWNHADPVLSQFAPEGGEPAYFEMMVSTLRRHGSKTFTSQPLATNNRIVSAELHHYPHDIIGGAPDLYILSFQSDPGTHAWPESSWATFSATAQILKFFTIYSEGMFDSIAQGDLTTKNEAHRIFTLANETSRTAISILLGMLLCSTAFLVWRRYRYYGASRQYGLRDGEHGLEPTSEECEMMS